MTNVEYIPASIDEAHIEEITDASEIISLSSFRYYPYNDVLSIRNVVGDKLLDNASKSFPSLLELDLERSKDVTDHMNNLSELEDNQLELEIEYLYELI